MVVRFQVGYDGQLIKTIKFLNACGFAKLTLDTYVAYGYNYPIGAQSGYIDGDLSSFTF